MNSSAASNSSTTVSLTEAPDMSYWTAYDHFMAERDARLVRRAYTYSMLAALGRAIRDRIAGARRAGARQRAEAH